MNYVLTVELDINEDDDIYPEHFMSDLAKDLENGKTSGTFTKEQSTMKYSITP